MKLKVIPFLLAGSVLLTACQQNANNIASPTIQKEDAVAVVNGEYISKYALETLTSEVNERTRGQNIPQEKLIDELVRRKLLVQQAESKKLDQLPETEQRLVMMKNALLSQLAIEDFIKSHPVSDADLKAEYNKQIGDTVGGTEYKARHILVKTEPEAVAIIAELDEGADFAELAKTQGGDLGWFGPKQMVAPFSDAVAKLDKGSYTKTPVKTQFGWHIIILEDTRVQTPPPFEAVKAQLEPLVQRQKMTAYLDTLRKDAKVEIFTAPETPATPTGVPAPSSNTADKAAPAETVIVETVTEEVTPTSDTVTETVEVAPVTE